MSGDMVSHKFTDATECSGKGVPLFALIGLWVDWWESFEVEGFNRGIEGGDRVEIARTISER